MAETVKGAIEVGLAGCSIEDYTTRPNDPYYSLDVAVDRIKAAVETKNRLAPDFVLTARSEGPVQTQYEFDETIKRLNAFVEAGADCVYAPQLKDKEQIAKVLSAVAAPLNILAGRKNFHLTRKELGDMGGRARVHRRRPCPHRLWRLHGGGGRHEGQRRLRQFRPRTRHP
ncbi:isocitrate lyase/PEP mutase family protein [Roseibium salinum]|nr:isocitrate lyase/PEP mutase family protein [Roseibium salinum]